MRYGIFSEWAAMHGSWQSMSSHRCTAEPISITAYCHYHCIITVIYIHMYMAITTCMWQSSWDITKFVNKRNVIDELKHANIQFTKQFIDNATNNSDIMIQKSLTSQMRWLRCHIEETRCIPIATAIVVTIKVCVWSMEQLTLRSWSSITK